MAGKVQLAVTGVQDELLTGDPQTTYFLKSFKRHTKFAVDIKDNQFDGDVNFGSSLFCIIPRKGDLIKTIFIKIKLSELSTANSHGVGYTDSICSALIDYADLVIGGQTIERLNGEYIEIYNELFVSNSQQEALKYLYGKTDSRNGLGPASGTVPGDYGTYPRTFTFPLPFYFFRNPSLAIPLHSINKQEVEVKIKLRNLNEVIVAPPSAVGVPTTTGTIESLSCPVEFVYISDVEKDFMSNKPINYIIEQLQMSRVTINPSETFKQVALKFVNPVKEMYFVIQDKDKVSSNILTGNDWYNYSNSQKVTSPFNEQLDRLSLDFNGENRINNDIADPLYLRSAQSMLHHTRTPTKKFYLYSFGLEPENHYPTGQVNMSRILNKILKVTTTSSTKERELRVYAKSINILRIENGLAGILFTDNNFI